MNLRQWRQQVEAAVEASGVPLGIYTLPNGERVPAINTGEPMEGVTAEGLEIIINPTPLPELISTFGGGINLKRWQARLVNHEGASLNFSAVLDALFEHFAPTVPNYMPETGEIAEQCVITVLNDPADQE